MDYSYGMKQNQVPVCNSFKFYRLLFEFYLRECDLIGSDTAVHNTVYNCCTAAQPSTLSKTRRSHSNSSYSFEIPRKRSLLANPSVRLTRWEVCGQLITKELWGILSICDTGGAVASTSLSG